MSSDDHLLAYLNGVFKPMCDCAVPINTHAFQYGTGCFEGIRGYWDGSRINLLFLREHLDRLHRNARMLFMGTPGVDEMCEVSVRLVRDNHTDSNVYLRPMVYKAGTSLGPRLYGEDDGFLLYQLPLQDYLDTSKGLDICVSSWRRLSDNSVPTRAKATGGYLNSALAKTEAQLNGYDEAVLLNEHGEISEGSAENIFLVRDGRLITPDKTACILEGITRAAVMELACERGMSIEERTVSRTELYRADEVFLVGTGCQISWVRSVDRRSVGDGAQGRITAQLQKAYEDAVYGRDPAKSHWLTAVQ